MTNKQFSLHIELRTVHGYFAHLLYQPPGRVPLRQLNPSGRGNRLAGEALAAGRATQQDGEQLAGQRTTGNAATATSVAFTGISGLDVTVTAEALKNAVAQMHEHANKAVLDALSDNSGTLQYNGAALATQTWVEENCSSTIELVASDPVADMKTGDLVLVTIA